MHCVGAACNRGKSQTPAGAGASLTSLKRPVCWQSRRQGGCVLVHGPTKTPRRSGPALSLCAADEPPAQRAEKETLAFKYNSVSGVSGCIVPVGSRVAWHAANRLEGTACDPTIRAAALQKLRGPGEVPPSCYQVRRSRPTIACEEGNCVREMKAARNHCPLSVLTCVLRYSDSRPVGSAHRVTSTDTISQLVNLNIERFTCLTIRRLDRGPRRRVCTRARSAVHFSGPGTIGNSQRALWQHLSYLILVARGVRSAW